MSETIIRVENISKLYRLGEVGTGSITMRGRVGALIALGAGFNPILTGREPKGWEARRKSNRRLDRREGANQNIYINGSVLGLTKTD
jgi:hypothetical protein